MSWLTVETKNPPNHWRNNELDHSANYRPIKSLQEGWAGSQCKLKTHQITAVGMSWITCIRAKQIAIMKDCMKLLVRCSATTGMTGSSSSSSSSESAASSMAGYCVRAYMHVCVRVHVCCVCACACMCVCVVLCMFVVCSVYVCECVYFLTVTIVRFSLKLI